MTRDDVQAAAARMKVERERREHAWQQTEKEMEMALNYRKWADNLAPGLTDRKAHCESLAREHMRFALYWALESGVDTTGITID